MSATRPRSARHLLWEVDQNAIPIGADFLPANLDPTTNKVLTNNFLRPINGYGSIYTVSFGSSSNYNSLQVSARRRLSRNVQFGAAWTWSKAMDYNDDGYRHDRLAGESADLLLRHGFVRPHPHLLRSATSTTCRSLPGGTPWRRAFSIAGRSRASPCFKAASRWASA